MKLLLISFVKIIEKYIAFCFHTGTKSEIDSMCKSRETIPLNYCTVSLALDASE
jgi:hypothetical protein